MLLGGVHLLTSSPRGPTIGRKYTSHVAVVPLGHVKHHSATLQESLAVQHSQFSACMAHMSMDVQALQYPLTW
jgi:hypothetical protein